MREGVMVIVLEHSETGHIPYSSSSHDFEQALIFRLVPIFGRSVTIVLYAKIFECSLSYPYLWEMCLKCGRPSQHEHSYMASRSDNRKSG